MLAQHTTVGYGSIVTVRREFSTKTETYQISFYTDLSRNIVSSEHPIGKGLMYHEKGDKVLVDDPKRYYFVEIVDIQNPPTNNEKEIK